MASQSFTTKLCNPFAADIFPDGETGADGTLTLHHDAEQRLEEEITQAAHEPSASVRSGPGRIILLKAPRAGYGKSYLLHRLRRGVAAEAIVIPIEFDPEEKIAWKPLLEQVLASLHEPLDPAGLTTLDYIARYTFAMVNAGLILNGKVPCAEPEQAAAALGQRYVELFDFSKKDQPVAAWFEGHFERLLPVSAQLLEGASGLSAPACLLWLRAFCGYSQAGAEGDPSRLETLKWALQQPVGSHPVALMQTGMQYLQPPTAGDQFHKEKLGELCRLAASFRPLVILLDHLDGFHGGGEKVLRLANFLNDWRSLSGRTRFILSVNQDLWTHTFLAALPSALEDRLTGGQITLGGISYDTAAELIQQRLTAWRVPEPVAVGFLHKLGLPQFFSGEAGRLVSPRTVLRYAAAAWQQQWTAPDPPEANAPGVSLASMRGILEKKLPVSTLGQPAAATQTASTQKVPAFTNGASHPPASGAILPDPIPSTPRFPAGESPFLTPRRTSPDHAIQVRFHTLRAHFASSPWLMLDQDRLFNLMKLSGQRLALVRFLETGLPGLPGAIAGAWQSPDAEILFGTEPYEDRTYWAALIDFARQRSAYVPGSRLVIFSSASSPVNLATWLDQDEIVSARAHFLDLQTLDHPSLAALYATDETLREVERGTLTQGSADAFVSMAPHLENLWKKLTRPLNLNGQTTGYA